MLKLISLAVVGISIAVSSFFVTKPTTLEHQALVYPQLECSGLTLDKMEVSVEEEVLLTTEVSHYGIIRFGKVEDTTKRAFESDNPQSLGLGGVSYFERTFTPTEPGFYVFEVNAYDDSNCQYLCSAGSILYQRTGIPQDRDEICTDQEIFSPVSECESDGCIAYLTVKDKEGVLPLECPVIGSTSCLSSGHIEVSWNSVEDGDLYQLQRNGETIRQFYGFEYTDEQVACATEYTYSVNVFSDTRSEAKCSQNVKVTCPCPTQVLPTAVPTSTVVPTSTAIPTLVPTVQPTTVPTGTPTDILPLPTNTPLPTATVDPLVPTSTPDPYVSPSPLPTSKLGGLIGEDTTEEISETDEGEIAQKERDISLQQIEGGDCYSLIPGYMFGLSAQEAEIFTCNDNGKWIIDTQSRLSSHLSSTQASQLLDLQVDNIQTPSIKNFTSSVQTGDAIVSYPIELPPSAGGFAPSLALSYSSGSVEDMKVGLDKHPGEWQKKFREEFKSQGSYVGIGWSVSGIPQIMKNSAGKYNLVLSGQGYDLIEDKNNSGQYKTSPESFLKITKSGDHSSGESWEIYDKNGTRYRFNASTASYLIKRKHACQPHIQGSCKLEEHGCNNYTNIKFENQRDYFRWMASEITDVNGNRIVYEYEVETKEIEGDCGNCGDCKYWRDPHVPDYGGNPFYPRAIYPKTISYGKDLQNKIVFDYGDITNPNDLRKDAKIKDFDSPNIVNFFGTRRLHAIDVKLGNHLLNTYQLDHQYDWIDQGKGQGHLLLASIKELGPERNQRNPFPAYQAFEYYNRATPNSYLLKTAHNGYGARVEYEYTYSHHEIPNAIGTVCRDDAHRGKYCAQIGKNRLTAKTIVNTHPSEQRLTTRYFYPIFDDGQQWIKDLPFEAKFSQAQDPDNCIKGTSCWNARAIMQDNSYRDYEFLGHSFVFEKTYANDSLENTTFYHFNQGEETGAKDSRVFTPSLFKGTLAKQAVFDKSGQIISLSENTYQIADKGFVYLAESKACSDLEVADESLRRASYSAVSQDHFDNYGNQAQLNSYYAKGCSLNHEGERAYGNVYALEASLQDVRLHQTTYAEYLNRDSLPTSYIIGKPTYQELRDGENKSLSLSLTGYDNLGRPTTNMVIDAAFLKSNSSNSARAAISRINYDGFGNVTSNTTYADYAIGRLVNNQNRWSFNVSSKPTQDRTSTITYDPQFQAFPISTTNPLGHSSQTTYDFQENRDGYVLGLPIKTIDANGLVSQVKYDHFGRVTAQASPDNRDTLGSPNKRYHYLDKDPGTNAAMAVRIENKTVDPDDARETAYVSSYIFYDALGRRLQTQSQSANNNLFIDLTEYDAMGRVITKHQGMELHPDEGCGRVLGKYSTCINTNYPTHFAYDTLGRVVRTTAPDGTCSLTRYEGRVSSIIDPEGNLSQAEIDTLGRDWRSYVYEKTSSPSASPSNFFSTLRTTLQRAGAWVASLFSAADNRHLNRIAQHAYNSSTFCQGEVVFPETNAYSLYQYSQQEYDALSRPIKTTTYDKDRSELITSSLKYDGFGRVTEANDPDMGTVKTDYDALGNATSTTDNAGKVKSYVYDELSRMTHSYQGERLLGRLFYDMKPGSPHTKNIGKLVAEETPNVLEKIYLYNPRGQVSSTTYQLLTNSATLQNTFPYKERVVVTNFYDAAGRLVTQSMGSSSHPNQPWIKDLIADSRYNYDLIGRANSIKYGASETNDRNMIVNPNNSALLVSNMTYNEFNQLVSQSIGHKVDDNITLNESFDYDLDNKTFRLKTHQVTRQSDSLPIFTLNYQAYDRVGNINKLSVKNANSNVAYEYLYDDFYRLVQEFKNGSTQATSAYQYDPLFRMTLKHEGNNEAFGHKTLLSYNSQTPVHAPVSALVSNSTMNNQNFDLNYDRVGNLLANTNSTFTYDHNNQITEVKNRNGGTIANYIYDYTGQRVKATEGSKTTYYHLPGVEIEKQGETTTIRRYLGATGMQELIFNSADPTVVVMGRDEGGRTTPSDTSNILYLTFKDHLSSTRLITDISGNYLSNKDKVADAAIDYYPYGSIRSGQPHQDLPVSRLYTDQISDVSSGLYYYNARYYDPILGIFTSADPVEGPNRYGYVAGNPIMRNDPSGNEGNDTTLYYHFSDPIVKYSPIPRLYIQYRAKSRYGAELTQNEGEGVGIHHFFGELNYHWIEATGIAFTPQEAKTALLIATGAFKLAQPYAYEQLNPWDFKSGMVTVYHGTSWENAQKIMKSKGVVGVPGRDTFSTHPNMASALEADAFPEGEVLQLKVPKYLLQTQNVGPSETVFSPSTQAPAYAGKTISPNYINVPETPNLEGDLRYIPREFIVGRIRLNEDFDVIGTSVRNEAGRWKHFWWHQPWGWGRHTPK